jgi:nucleoside triphosphate diphosphatase
MTRTTKHRRDTTHGQPAIDRLIAIMAKLRDPKSGCPWDLEQSFATIAPYTIEEAYETAEAAERGDLAALKEELGDLLLQVVFHARMAEEQGAFGFTDVAAAIAEKMVKHHPHVFGQAKIGSAVAQTLAWEAQKAQERREKAESAGVPRPSALDGVGLGLPALTRAAKLQRRAARIGFDWPDSAEIYAKIAEEIAELKAESEPIRVADEIGDLLFTVVNLARRLETDPEQALRGACRKFERRFRAIENHLAARGESPESQSLNALESLWQEVKAEKNSGS